MWQSLRAEQPSFTTYLNIFSTFLAIGFVFVVVIIASNHEAVHPVDYQVYIQATQGDFSGYYYPHWILWLMYPFSQLPYYVGFALWVVLNIVCLVYATHTFGGKLWVLMLSYQLLWIIYYGQIVGIVAGGLAFYWVHIKDRPLISGIGVIFALAKPHVSIPILLAIGLMRSSTWRGRLYSTVPMWCVLGLSLLVEPTWIADLLLRLENTPPSYMGNISLYQWVGPWALILWLGILLPMPNRDKLIVIVATTALSLPYYQQSGLLILYAFPISYLPLLGNLSFVLPFFDDPAILGIAAIVPLVAYIYFVSKALLNRSTTE